MTSIVILTFNQLSFTRMCVESILQYTDEPYELIFVDNASSDGTLDYLRSVPHTHLIANTTNRGFPAGANQGMRVAQGRQVLLLNNDTVVTTGWLRRLLRALHADPTIGLAGPCSNCVSGEQQISVPYDDLGGIDGFAWDWGLAHDCNLLMTDRLVGFCLLIRREVIERVGLLDERFGIGCFEDDDYCLRALRVGFRAVVAQDSFVHHFGGRTFVGSAVDYAGLMERNQAMFLKKWSKEANPAPTPSPALPEPASRKSVTLAIQKAPEGGLLLVGREMHLSLCMIVRDNARTIGACLESICAWVDEMIVIDTGSKDETPQIAQELGARVFHFPWCDDFSAARNESLRHARGRWIFWMDSDDTINPDCGRKLRELAYNDVDSRTLGFIMQVHCPGPGESGHNDLTVVDHVKLFRNLPQLRFDGRIHEQILPAIRAMGGDVAWTPLFVVHSGYDHSPEGQEKKKQRDLRILQLELSERPTHPFTLFNLGMTYADIGEYRQAVDFLERSLRHSSPEESHLRKVYSLLVYCHTQMQEDGAAWRRCGEGLRLFPKDLELRFRLGVLQHSSGQLEAAAATYQQLLGEKTDRYFTSMDRGIQGFKARQNLAVVYTDLRDYLRAEEQWRLVVAEAPQYELGWQGLADVLLRQQKTADALAVADQLVICQPLRSQGLLLRSQVALLRQDEESASYWLRKGIQNGLLSLDPLRALCQFFFEHGSPSAAEEPLRELLQRVPEDAATYHNLGTVYMSLGRHVDAVNAYEASVRFRPNSVATHVLLSDALRKVGRLAESRSALQRVLQMEPHNQDAIEALRQMADFEEPHSNSTGLLEGTATQTHSLPLRDRTISVSLTIRGAVDRSILEEIWLRDVYQVRDLDEPPAVVLDIGAHIGIFSLLASEAWPQARIVACEPDPENFSLLQRNLHMRRNIETVEAAIVGSNVSEIAFQAVTGKALNNSGGGSCFRDEPCTVKIRVPALSAVKLWQNKNINTCDLLKLDCEGAEIAILQALADAHLLNSIRLIVGEWHANESRSDSTSLVKKTLQAVLETTHDLEFNQQHSGREGYFRANRRQHR